MARPSARILGKVAGSLILAAGILLLFTQTQLFSRQAASGRASTATAPGSAART